MISSLRLATLPFAPTALPAGDPCADGYWELPATHQVAGFQNPPPNGRFIAAHMALIPNGPHRGKAIVWDYDGSQVTPAWSGDSRSKRMIP